jgi:hypothetical protein
MTLVELQQDVLKMVQEATSARTVDLYAGRFSPKEIDSLNIPMPAALLACSGFKPNPDVGLPDVVIDMTVAILVDGDKRPQRNLQAQAMAERLLLAFCNSGLPRHSPPEVTNLYDEACDERGVAFYMVTWQQTLQLTIADDPSLTDFEEIYAQWRVVPDSEQEGKPLAEALIKLNPEKTP